MKHKIQKHNSTPFQILTSNFNVLSFMDNNHQSNYMIVFFHLKTKLINQTNKQLTVPHFMFFFIFFSFYVWFFFLKETDTKELSVFFLLLFSSLLISLQTSISYPPAFNAIVLMKFNNYFYFANSNDQLSTFNL